MKRSLPLGFDLESLSDLDTLVAEHVLELLFLVAEHLDFTLVELNVLIDSSDHFLHTIKFKSVAALTSSWESLFLRDPVVPPRD